MPALPGPRRVPGPNVRAEVRAVRLRPAPRRRGARAARGWRRIVPVLVLLGGAGVSVPSAGLGQDGPVTAPPEDRRLALAEAYAAAGDPVSAIGWYRDALSRRPELEAAWLGLARAHAALGRAARARRVLEEAFRRRPASVRIARALIDALQGLGAFDAAFQVARRLVAEGPEDPAAHALRAELAQARGAWSEALAAQRAILALARRRPGRLSPEARDQAQAAAEALVLLVGELDPVTAPRSCAPDAAPARRALAGRCEGNAARLR